MFIPLWLIALTAILIVVLIGWTASLVRGRNPLPFPDLGSRIFAASSPEAKSAVVALLARHGVAERFHADSDGVLRSILWDGTIINWSQPEVVEKLGSAVASIGLVSRDPATSAEEAARFLRERGFEAHAVLDADPGLPVAHVVTDALSGSTLNFRKHVLHMPRPTRPS